MCTLDIKNVEDFISLEGSHLGFSDWIQIDQKMINAFAAATKDQQWIHVDEDRAKSESPYGCTIAHGYLLLSLLPHLISKVINVENLRNLINYSIDKMVFNSPVTVGSKVRLSLTLKSVKDLGQASLNTYSCIIECGDEAERDTAMEGSIKYVYYFEPTTNN